MTTSATRPVSSLRVPVSTTETRLSKRETGVPALVGANKGHMHRLIGVLVHTYGWTLGQDGNLYSPCPLETSWGERVA
jgi:hypothetical protein